MCRNNSQELGEVGSKKNVKCKVDKGQRWSKLITTEAWHHARGDEAEV
jgi:hypothetical protein